MFQTEVITDPLQFKNLKLEWNKLLEQSNTNSIFLTWEWTYSWWEVFGRSAELFIITAKNGTGKLVAIAPLLIRKSHYYKFPVREMIFIGMGHSDRQDFIIADPDTRLINNIISKIYKFKDRWDIINLEQIPSTSLLLENKVFEAFTVETEFSSLCPYVTINDSWDSYFKSFSKKFRKDIRNKTNKVKKLGHYTFQVVNNISDFGTLFNSIKKIESQSRKHNTEKEFFSKKENEIFLIKFCTSFKKNDLFDFSSITLNDTLMAYLIGFIYNDKYYAYNIAYSNDFFDVSPGKLLINEKIKWCFNNREIAREFDFLRGDFYIKSLWSTDSRKHMRVVFFNHTLYARILRYLVFRIRPLLKNIATFFSTRQSN